MDKEFIENPVEAYEKLKQECAKWQKIVEIFREKLYTSTIKRMNLEAERNYCYYALKNITKGKIDSYCYAEEYAKKVLKAVKMAVKNLEYNKGLKAIKTLAEIKPMLEFYANSKMGEEQPDRTYKIMLSGGYIMVYDPKPAREALRKINEVEDDKSNN